MEISEKKLFMFKNIEVGRGCVASGGSADTFMRARLVAMREQS
jgi:hypothetical protein